MNDDVAIGIDLGGTKILGVLVEPRGEVLSRRERATEAGDGPDAVLASMAALSRELAASAPGKRLAGVGVGVPGPLDPRTGVVWAMPNLHPGFLRFPMKARLEALLPGTPVFVENDANAATHGECWIGAARGCQDAVLLTLGTGVGGGIVTGGTLVRGSKGAGAELGHLCVEPEGAPCGCGGRGCLEQYASGTAVARLVREELARKREGALASVAEPVARHVLEAAREGDALALRVLARAAHSLAVGLVSIVHALNPELIVIGGGFGTASFDLLVPLAEKELASRTFAASREGLRIVPAGLGVDAGAIGAARSAFSSASPAGAGA